MGEIQLEKWSKLESRGARLSIVPRPLPVHRQILASMISSYAFLFSSRSGAPTSTFIFAGRRSQGEEKRTLSGLSELHLHRARRLSARRRWLGAATLTLTQALASGRHGVGLGSGCGPFDALTANGACHRGKASRADHLTHRETLFPRVYICLTFKFDHVAFRSRTLVQSISMFPSEVFPRLLMEISHETSGDATLALTHSLCIDRYTIDLGGVRLRARR